MKDNTLNALMVIIIILIGLFSLWVVDKYTPTEQSSSFVGYSQSCWQVGDSLYVVTAKGDTLKWDVSKLK